MKSRKEDTDDMYGVTELYRPEKGVADIDIVAVHGLGGSAKGTWTGTDGKGDPLCWLDHPDFLPKYLPNARILAYGYNASFSTLTGPVPSHDRIHHHAITLVQNLYGNRAREKRANKPIIFLCHSLGGTVVKQALSLSDQQRASNTSHLSSIATCTSAMLFFGTPHHGAEKAHMLGTLQKLAKLSVPRPLADFEPGLLKALETESETLQNITLYFVPMMKNFNIFFFWEQEKTNLRYKHEYIVSEHSAAPVHDNTERAGIPANHCQMVKFTTNSSAFQVVIEALQRYCEAALGRIPRRLQHAMEEQKRKATQDLSDLRFETEQNTRNLQLLVTTATSHGETSPASWQERNSVQAPTRAPAGLIEYAGTHANKDISWAPRAEVDTRTCRHVTSNLGSSFLDMGDSSSQSHTSGCLCSA